MPKYFFHVHDGVSVPDEDGTELPDIYSAQTEAIKLCGALIRDLGARFWDHGEWRLDVCSAEQALLFTLTLNATEKELVGV